jgi:nucleotide-binding universal stress UspA family protein
VAVIIGLVSAAIADGIAGLGNYAAIAAIVALFSLAVAAPTAVLARIWPPLVIVAVLVFIVLGIPVSGGPANLASFGPAFLRVLDPVLPLGLAASVIRNVVYFGGHATALHLWILAAWALAGLAGLVLLTARRRPVLDLTEPVLAPVVEAVPGVAGGVEAVPGPSPADRAPVSGAVQPITLVVGFDNSEPARRALVWAADLLRERPGTLHVIYADHPLIDSDLGGFAHAEMEDTRDQKAASAAQAAAEIAATAGVPYTFERREESPASAILSAAGRLGAAAADRHGPDEPAGTPIIVTGRSHHAAHRILGSVPVELLHESPYPVLTIS